MTEQSTHPVYIDSDKKTEVKKTAAGVEESMRTVTERYVEHGSKLDLHELPINDDTYRYVFNRLVEAGVLTYEDEDDGLVQLAFEE